MPIIATMKMIAKATDGVSYRKITLSKDEGNRPDTTVESLAALRPVLDGGVITAGNASQLSDGASACVVMEARMAQRRGLRALGVYRGIADAGNAPEEMTLDRYMLFRSS